VGAYRSLLAPPGVFAFERWHPEGVVEVHLNFGDVPRTVELGGPGRVALSTVGVAAAGEPVGRVELAPYEGVIVDRA
jgi:hypothetical protein